MSKLYCPSCDAYLTCSGSDKCPFCGWSEPEAEIQDKNTYKLPSGWELHKDSDSFGDVVLKNTDRGESWRFRDTDGVDEFIFHFLSDLYSSLN